MALVTKKFSAQSLAEIEVGERVVTGMILENYSTEHHALVTIIHRFYVAVLRAQGFSLAVMADGVVGVLPIADSHV